MVVKVRIDPQPEKNEKVGTGIKRVVNAQYRYLPQMGVELVDDPASADVYAAHVFAPSGYADVVHCHGLYPTGEMQMPNWAYEINERIIDAVMHAKIVTVPSPWVAEIFERNMGFSPVVVGHGIDVEEWPERTGPPPCKVLWNKCREHDVCTTEPLEQLVLRRPNVDFVATFGTPKSNLEITGAMPFAQMKELLYQCGVYFAPTKETFGIGILEAMAAGMPVLTWNWGHNRELVQHGVTGYIAEPEDYQDTARGLDYCIEHAERLGRAARQVALKHGWQPVIERYKRLYEIAATAETDAHVTVVIPCYNYEAYVAKAIESVKKQTYTDWDCVIVDDGSTDNSVEVIQRAIEGDGRFRLIRQENSKVAAARNRGALESRGTFLCFMDADDWMLPRCLELLVAPMIKDVTLGISYGKLKATGESLRERVGPWPPEFSIDRQLSRHNQVPSCCVIRRSAFWRAGGYRIHTIPAEDAEFWTRICLMGYRAKLATEEPVYMYRVHDQSATALLSVRGGKYIEPNWTAWIAACNGGPEPMASPRAPKDHKRSHPVYNYDRPLVSIITVVGDKHRKMLFHAIESVNAQTDHRWEHIIVDDTTEGSLESFGLIPYKRRYPYLKWVRSPKLHNVSAARNAGAQQARGRFLCYLDADDMIHRDFLRVTLKAAEKYPQAMIYTDWVELPEEKVHQAEEWNLMQLMKHALFAVTFLHPKEAFETVGGFDERLEIWEDWDYEIRLALCGYPGVRVPQALFSYNYATGTRREECLERAEELLQDIHKRYEAIVRASLPTPTTLPDWMTRAAKKVVDKPQPRRLRALKEPDRKAPAGYVKVRYKGNAAGRIMFTAPSGTKYRFGTGKHAVKSVWTGDVPYFKGLGSLFEVLED